MAPRTVEVHNSFTLYGANPDGTEAKDKFMAALTRPQDWGAPYWHFDQAKFEWNDGEIHYIHHVYMWTDVKRKNEFEYLKLFAGVIVFIAQPGDVPQLCGKDFLKADDSWHSSWGPLPPLWKQEDGDWLDLEGEYEDEPVE